jgi:hypothetical protein
MADINTALAASKEAIERLIVTGERGGPAWSAPRAPGKWSPSQIVEHVARSLEESANMAAGRIDEFDAVLRTLFCRLRQLLEQYAPDGVHPKRGPQEYCMAF